MRDRFRLFKRRNGIYYAHDNLSGKQHSLRTADKEQAKQLLQTKNQAQQTTLLNRELGRIYLSASDPTMTQRTWSAVMDELESHGSAERITRTTPRR